MVYFDILWYIRYILVYFDIFWYILIYLDTFDFWATLDQQFRSENIYFILKYFYTLKYISQCFFRLWCILIYLILQPLLTSNLGARRTYLRSHWDEELDFWPPATYWIKCWFCECISICIYIFIYILADLAENIWSKYDHRNSKKICSCFVSSVVTEVDAKDKACLHE